ncbi:MAG: hypothetical protein AAFN92_05100, partial [Bacteroidota bacterium]
MHRLTFVCLFLVFTCGLTAQSAPEVEGDLLSSGTLEYRNVVSGNYRLTDNGEAKKNTYTLTLMDNDLQPIGSKVYRNDKPLRFEDIAFNGSNLALLILEGDEKDNRRFIDIVDGSGELVRREFLIDGSGSTGHFLHPQADGFVSCVSWGEAPKRPYPRRRFELRKTSTQEEAGDDWRSTFTSKKEGNSLYPRFLTGNEENLALFVRRGKNLKSGPQYQDVFTVDLTTGKTVYRQKETIKDDPNVAQRIVTGKFVGEELILVRFRSRRRKIDRAWLSLERLDATGKEVVKEKYAVDGELRKLINGPETLAEDSLRGNVQLAPSRMRLNEKGEFVIGFEAYKLSYPQFEFRDAYLLAFGADFAPVAATKVPKTWFKLSPNHLEEINGYQTRVIRKKMLKGETERFTMT